MILLLKTYSKKTLESVQTYLSKYNPNTNKNPLPTNLFEPYKKEITDSLSGRLFEKFAESEKFTRFCQWKNYELNIQLTMNDFSVHRIIGRGGFGEVYGCRKADTGKMYAMKCLDKKRIKMKQGESLALNERMMLSSVSNGVSFKLLSHIHLTTDLYRLYHFFLLGWLAIHCMHDLRLSHA